MSLIDLRPLISNDPKQPGSRHRLRVQPSLARAISRPAKSYFKFSIRLLEYLPLLHERFIAENLQRIDDLPKLRELKI